MGKEDLPTEESRQVVREPEFDRYLEDTMQMIEQEPTFKNINNLCQLQSDPSLNCDFKPSRVTKK